jgi:hypothetical protein
MLGCGERRGVGGRIGARHLELHRARVRQPDVHGRLAGNAAQDPLEHVARVQNLRALQRLERRPSFDPGAVRRQDSVERFVGFAELHARDRRGKSVAAARVGLDVLVAGALFERASKGRDRLLEAVVGNGDVGPRGRDQLILRKDLARARDQDAQQIELPRAERNRVAVARQPPRPRIQLKGSERESFFGHARIVLARLGGAGSFRTLVGRQRPGQAGRNERRGIRAHAAHLRFGLIARHASGAPIVYFRHIAANTWFPAVPS